MDARALDSQAEAVLASIAHLRQLYNQAQQAQRAQQGTEGGVEQDEAGEPRIPDASYFDKQVRK